MTCLSYVPWTLIGQDVRTGLVEGVHLLCNNHFLTVRIESHSGSSSHKKKMDLHSFKRKMNGY